jgi:type II secretory pathway component PulM
VSELLARIRASFEGLAPRDRLAVVAMAGALCVAVFAFGLVQPILGASNRAGQRLAGAEQELAAVRELRARYDEVNARLSVVEARIKDGPRGEIFTTLEQLAKQSAVKIDSMEPRTSPASEEYRETKVQVVLKSVTLVQMVNYLHRIESAPQLLSIKSLRVRSRSDDSELLDVTFSVSSFEALAS